MRAAIVPRMPFIGMIDAVSWPAGSVIGAGRGRHGCGGAGLRRRCRSSLDVAAPDDAVAGRDGGGVDPGVAGVAACQWRDDLAGLARAAGLRAARGGLLDVLGDDASARTGAGHGREIDIQLLRPRAGHWG